MMDAKETGRVQPVKVMNFPHTFVIILAMIVVALILTWVVPAGMYDFIKTPSGQKVVDPATFRYIKSTGINPVLIPLYIIKSFSKRIDLMMVIFMAGSAFHVVTKTGALQAILAKGAKRFSNRLEVFIPVLTLIFGLICTTQGVNTFIPFAPVMVMLAMAMGLDSITGEAIMVLGGAIGFSTGLIYMPCAYGQTKEVVEMCKVVAEYDGRFVIHQRSEADTILDSMKEVIQIGKESGVKIHYSHFKVCGRKNWDKIDGMIQLLEEAEKEGIDVSFDQYPYVAGSTMLGVILPPWVHDGGTNKVIERLNDPELRKKMVYDIEHGIPGWDNFVDFAGLDQIYVTSVKTDKNKDAVGLSLIELGKLRGKDPYDATFDLLRDEENAVGMVDFYGTEDHVKLFMKRPEMNVCTDGLLGGKPHPRVYGAFPRVLGKYVREDKALTLEQAVYKMTGKPAATFNIKNRGQIKEGAYADITVFNPDTVIDKGTFTDPTQYPEGIEYVMVNGVFEVAGGKYTGRRNGTVLRKKGKEVVK